MSFAVITLCVTSQRVFIVYFVIDPVRKLFDTPSYSEGIRVESRSDYLIFSLKLFVVCLCRGECWCSRLPSNGLSLSPKSLHSHYAWLSCLIGRYLISVLENASLKFKPESNFAENCTCRIS
jgi:hypothetical protein